VIPFFFPSRASNSLPSMKSLLRKSDGWLTFYFVFSGGTLSDQGRLDWSYAVTISNFLSLHLKEGYPIL